MNFSQNQITDFQKVIENLNFNQLLSLVLNVPPVLKLQIIRLVNLRDNLGLYRGAERYEMDTILLDSGKYWSLKTLRF